MLEVVGQVAGIGGLSLGVLLLLFREIIRKNIFPNLTKTQAYSIIKLIVVLTFIVAAFGIVAWVYIELDSNHELTVQKNQTPSVDIPSYSDFISISDLRKNKNLDGKSPFLNFLSENNGKIAKISIEFDLSDSESEAESCEDPEVYYLGEYANALSWPTDECGVYWVNFDDNANVNYNSAGTGLLTLSVNDFFLIREVQTGWKGVSTVYDLKLANVPFDIRQQSGF